MNLARRIERLEGGPSLMSVDEPTPQEAEARQSFLRFVCNMLPNLPPARHHETIAGRLQAVADGRIRRLMITLPPGHAKSTYASILFPAWSVGRCPDRSLIAASHTAELATRFGRRVRNLVCTPEFQRIFPDVALSGDSKAADRWDTTAGGEYFAAGVGGAVTGRRADLAIIDDPIKGRETAESETQRENSNVHFLSLQYCVWFAHGISARKQ